METQASSIRSSGTISPLRQALDDSCQLTPTMPIPIYISSPITTGKTTRVTPKTAACFDIKASHTPRTFETPTESYPSAQPELAGTPMSFAESAAPSPFASFGGFGESTRVSAPADTIDEGLEDEIPPVTVPTRDIGATPTPSAPPTLSISGFGDISPPPRMGDRARHSRRASYFTPPVSMDNPGRRASEDPLLPSHNSPVRRASETPPFPSRTSPMRQGSEASILPCHNSPLRRVSDAPGLPRQNSWSPIKMDYSGGRPTIAATSPLTAPCQRSGHTPPPMMTEHSGTDLSSPPGYRQNIHASEFSSSQRAAHEASVAQESPQKMSLAAIGIGEDEGVWVAARRWASFAGDSFASAEEQVWKRINRD